MQMNGVKMHNSRNKYVLLDFTLLSRTRTLSCFNEHERTAPSSVSKLSSFIMEASSAILHQPTDDSTNSFVSLCFSNKVLGLACYEEVNNTIFCGSINVSVENMEDVISGIKVSFRPTLFLLHPRVVSNKSLLEVVLAGPDLAPDAYRFKVLKNSVWNDKASYQMIHRYLEIRGNDRVQSTYQQLACVLDLEQEQSRIALGAIIAYMQETVFKLDSGKVIVSSVKRFTQESFMKIDQASLQALQIFSEEIHPNVMKGKGRSKEGFSLFGLFDRTHSLPGRQRLRDWMSSPFCDKSRILHRQKGVAVMARPCNRDFVAGFAALLRHFHDLPKLLLRVKKVEATHVEWCKIHTSLQAAQKVLDHIRLFVASPLTDPEDGAYIGDICADIDVNAIYGLTQVLSSAIDFHESEAQGAVTFHEAYDATLDRLRLTYMHLETHLVAAAHQVLEIVPLLQNVSVEYVPQVGYVVAVREEDVHLLEHTLPSGPAGPISSHSAAPQSQLPHNAWGHAAAQYSQVPPQLQYPQRSQHGNYTADPRDQSFVDWETPAGYDEYAAFDPTAQSQQCGAEEQADEQVDDSFHFMYMQAGVHYFKHRIVQRMDRDIGDIKSEITDRQRLLLLQIEDTLLDAEEPLQQLSVAVSTLDALISLGTIAVEYRLAAPEISDECTYLIKGGRNLLQELTVDNFVPNDTFISAEKNVALISGPNTSGKSVYLKQVGLIVYLAHIGSFVPCERARIGLTDRIMTRISSTETVSAPQSAFALDLQQVSKMLGQHTRRSLCLVDEFGKGTMPVDGIALLAATVKHFAEKGGAALFVLHFTEILQDDVLSDEVLRAVSCFRMETLEAQATAADADWGDAIPRDFGTDFQERTPLFRLKKGVATSSEGIPCARSAGVAEAILVRAAQVKGNVLRHQPIQAHHGGIGRILQRPEHAHLLSAFLQTKHWASDEGEAHLGQIQQLLAKA